MTFKEKVLDWLGLIGILSGVTLAGAFIAILMILRVTWPFAAIVAGVYVALVLADKI